MTDEARGGPTYDLYNADSISVMTRWLGANRGIDVIITDTPYGIGFEYDTYDDSFENWVSLINSFVPLAKALSPFTVMPSCAINRLGWWYANHPPDWLISWHKGSPGHAAKIGFNDWEPHVCWGRPSKPMHDAFRTSMKVADNGHPCPKPLAWAMWLVEKSTNPGDTVLDPFMGSGTVGVAAMMLGRSFIGIELDSGYFEIADIAIKNASGTFARTRKEVLSGQLSIFGE